MYIAFIFVYLYNILLSFFVKIINKKEFYIAYIPLVFFLSWFGASNIKALSVDYENYANWIDTIYYSDGVNFFLDKDPGFALIVKIINFLFGYNYFFIFFIFIFLILISKIKLALDFLPKNLALLFLILCFSRYYIIHDVNQIRAGLSIIIGTYLSIKYLNKDINKYFYLFLIILLSTVHSSILILLVVVFIGEFFNFLNKKSTILILFFMSIVSFFFSGLINEKISGFFSGYLRYSVYLESGGFEDAKINILSFFILVKIFIIIINILIWDNLSDTFKKISTLSCVGLFLALAFSQIAVLGWRFSEIFAYFDFLSVIAPLIFLKLNMYARFLYILLWFFISFLMLYSSLVVIN